MSHNQFASSEEDWSLMTGVAEGSTRGLWAIYHLFSTFVNHVKTLVIFSFSNRWLMTWLRWDVIFDPHTQQLPSKHAKVRKSLLNIVTCVLEKKNANHCKYPVNTQWTWFSYYVKTCSRILSLCHWFWKTKNKIHLKTLWNLGSDGTTGKLPQWTTETRLAVKWH